MPTEKSPRSHDPKRRAGRQIAIVFSASELEALREAAERAGLTASEYVRRVVRRAREVPPADLALAPSRRRGRR